MTLDPDRLNGVKALTEWWGQCWEVMYNEDALPPDTKATGIFPYFPQTAAMRCVFIAYANHYYHNRPVNLTLLSKTSGISRATLQRAKKELIDEGHLVPWEGSFSLTDEVMDEWGERLNVALSRPSFYKFINQTLFGMIRQNLADATRFLSRGTILTTQNDTPISNNYSQLDTPDSANLGN